MSNQPPVDHHFWGRSSASPATPTPQSLYHPSPPSRAPYLPQHAPGRASSTPPPPPPLTPPSTPLSSPSAYSATRSIFSAVPPSSAPLRLFSSKLDESAHAENFEDMSAVFSVITSLERLENIWARRGALSREDYEQQCELLIQQFRVLKESPAIPKLDLFIAEYSIKATKARPRLLSGVPATVFTPGRTGAGKEESKFVLRCTSLFHHVGDCIELQQVQVGSLLPELTSLMKTLGRIRGLGGEDYEFGKKIRYWVETLNGMPAGVELPRQECMQLKLDLDNGYIEFESAISD